MDDQDNIIGSIVGGDTAEEGLMPLGSHPKPQKMVRRTSITLPKYPGSGSENKSPVIHCEAIMEGNNADITIGIDHTAKDETEYAHILSLIKSVIL